MGWLRDRLGRRRRDAEMDEEMREHLRLLVERNLAAGMTPAEARRRARLTFGPVDAIQEKARDQRPLAGLETALRDLRQGARVMRKHPGFTAVVVLTLALGTGANTAMFSVVDGVLLRPLDYPESDRLVRLAERNRDGGAMAISYPNFLDWRAQQTVFESLGVWRVVNANLTGVGQPRRLAGLQMNAGVFEALRVPAALGRTFGPEEDRPGAAPVVVLSHELWQQLGGDPNVVGSALSLDGGATTVVGVMPAGFQFQGASLWVPFGPESASFTHRIRRAGHRGLARLKPGLTLSQAQVAMEAIGARLEQQYPDSNRRVRPKVDSLLDSQVGGLRRPLWILLGAAGLVLIIACANVAGLLLARSLVRRPEMAIRAALGAGRARLVRQALTESLLLAAAGTAAGLLVAQLVHTLFLKAAENRIPRAAEIGLEGRVWLFSAAVAVLTALLFGLAPAWREGKVDLQSALRAASPAAGGGSRLRLRQALVMGQVALTVMLLSGAGLLLRSFHQLRQVDLGFQDERVVSFRLNLPEQKYRQRVQQVAFYETLLTRLRALPGVTSASLGSQLPLDDRNTDVCLFIEGRPGQSFQNCSSTEINMIDADYFQTLGIPLLRGRTFGEQDGDRARLVTAETDAWSNVRAIVVDRQFARRYWPDQDPLGKRVRLPWPPDAPERQPVMTVVGLVGAVKLDRPGEPETRPQAYFPHWTGPAWSMMSVVLKTPLPVESIVEAARREVLALDPEQPIFEVRTLTELRDRSLGPERLNLLLLGSFAALALLLAVIGLYGLLAYSVAQRRREIGVRVALGAGRGRVLRLIVGQGMALAAAGVALGAAGGLLLSRLLRTLLYGVQPGDPITFCAVAALLLLVALLASYLPARRAAALDPMLVLRQE